ncbi:MAG: hypothetical protein HY471_02055 [Candidatus Sungbacteria bacterium]|nr:hypothetical protein [Candidatus Sungbacteria bacterium]
MTREEEIKELQAKIAELTPGEKDLLLAHLGVSVDRLFDILKDLISKNELSIKKEGRQEIEHIISLGPKWLNYTGKFKKRK